MLTSEDLFQTQAGSFWAYIYIFIVHTLIHSHEVYHLVQNEIEEYKVIVCKLN